MRALSGFVALHAAFVGTGVAVLRAAGLVAGGHGWRALGRLLGPAFVVGVAVVVPGLIVLLVAGVPLTLFTVGLCCAGWSSVSMLIVRRRDRTALRSSASSTQVPRFVSRMVVLGAGAYAAVGAAILGRLPTVWDDARIWSLRGITLADYHALRPEIFLNPGQSGGHPIYPLFQPVLEAVVSQAMGSSQSRFFHAELWLLFLATIWMAAFLIGRRGGWWHRRSLVWLPALAVLAITPAAIKNIAMGDADITGSVLLATGALALAVWLQDDDNGALAIAVALLAAAANTKDEDLIAVVIVLAVAGLSVIFQRREGGGLLAVSVSRLGAYGWAVLYVAAVVAPWRVWTAAHHLSDAVEPPIPRALNPAYIVGRSRQLHQTVSAMLTQVSSEWGWLAALFIATCLACVVYRTGRRIACFYLAAFALIVGSLIWLYATTPVSLAFLLPTSMNRTVDVFMVLAAVGTAHLVANLAAPSGQGGT